MGRLAPFARVRVTVTDGNTVTMADYAGMNGIGLLHAPSVSISSWVVTLDWPDSFEDELGRIWPINLRAISVDGEAAQGQGTIDSPTSVSAIAGAIVLATPTPIAGDWTITVYGSPLESAAIGDYGGSRDKRNCATESIPYTASWYDTMQGARGDLYSQDRSGLVHVENLALARHFAWQNRLAEQLYTNANSATAGVSLPEWVEILQIPVNSGDTPADIRSALAAKEQQTRGPDPVTIDEQLSNLLGDYYVRTWRTPGTLASPPDYTYGPAWDTGPLSWDLGGGTWASVRSRITVEVTAPADAELGPWSAAIDRAMGFLDDAEPVYVTFDWATGLSDESSDDPDAVLGFRLDLDRMDYVGMS
jgi:hypothetical protein